MSDELPYSVSEEAGNDSRSTPDVLASLAFTGSVRLDLLYLIVFAQDRFLIYRSFLLIISGCGSFMIVTAIGCVVDRHFPSVRSN